MPPHFCGLDFISLSIERGSISREPIPPSLCRFLGRRGSLSLNLRSPTNHWGGKGIGELPTIAAPVAVANAVRDDISTRVSPRQRAWNILSAARV